MYNFIFYCVLVQWFYFTNGQIDKMAEKMFQLAVTYDTDITTVETLLNFMTAIIQLERKPRLPQTDQLNQQILYSFQNWVNDQLEVNNVVVQSTPNYRIGLVANGTLKDTDHLMMVKLEQTFNSYHAKARFHNLKPLIQSFHKNASYSSAWKKDFWISLMMLSEQLNPASKWRPYLNVLPGSFIHPLYFTIKEYEVLQDSHGYKSAVTLLQEMLAQWAVVLRYVSFYPVSLALYRISSKTFSLQLWRWAYTVTLTKSFSLGAGSAVIPFWDMINHNSNANMDTQIIINPPDDVEKLRLKNRPIVPEGEIQAFAITNITKGDQIFMKYTDDKATLENFLVSWGFLEPLGAIRLPLYVRRSMLNYRRRIRGLSRCQKVIKNRGMHIIWQPPLSRFNVTLEKRESNLLFCLACNKIKRRRVFLKDSPFATELDKKKINRLLLKSMLLHLAGYTRPMGQNVDRLAATTSDNMKLVLSEIIQEQKVATLWNRIYYSGLSNQLRFDLLFWFHL